MADKPHAAPVSIGGVFGWFHPGHGPDARVPVLLCPPLGLEYLTALQGWRELALNLAASGHGVLRLDYPGTGNSPGDALAPNRLVDWLASIADGVEALKAATGAPGVVLVGMRLGASLAAMAAQGRDDVAGYIALAPVVSGRRYARELTAQARMQGEGGASAAGIVVHGFEISTETLQALAGLDMSALPAPCPAGLVLARNEDEALLARQWQLESAPFEGFEAFTENPTHAQTPHAALAAVQTFCAQQPRPTFSGTVRPLPPAHFDLPEGHEDGVLFGPENALFGVLSQPHGTASSLGVLVLNGGRNPLMGWGRQSVELARALSAQGQRVLRMDTNGIGDSPRADDSPEEVLYSTRQQADVLAGIARLRQAGARAVFIIGACSGAHLALQVGRSAPDVAGLGLINLLRFHWHPGDSLDVVAAQSAFRPTGAYGRRLFQGDTWRRLWRGEIRVGSIAQVLARRVLAALQRPLTHALALMGLAHSPRLEARGWFRTLSERGALVSIINAAEDPALAELAAYFGPDGHELSGIKGVERRVVQGLDHNLSGVRGRAEVRTVLLDAVAQAAQVLDASGNVAPRQ